MDLAGDGQTDLVVMERPLYGFYERTLEETWESFEDFSSWPGIDTRNPNLKFIDLTGDGHPDIMITEDQAFLWHASLLEAGFAPAQRVMQVFDEEKGPHLIFADMEQSIFLADLSGDGLADLVRIRNGEVCYWPNLGYGRFGFKVTMDNAPWFDDRDQFDQRRIRLADIDGSGVTDIIYLHREGIRLYYNQSGNSWSAATELKNSPAVDNVKNITVVDLLGNGTACLVWSSALPGDSPDRMQYLDLMGGQKPHLLIKSINNMGAETRMFYAPSTKFYLDDKQSGRPWVTRLPFPVHVVERVETYDYISRNRFVTRYAYHHGYFDGVEREFRGFGMVEQFDTEEFAALSGTGNFPSGDNVDAASHVPPIHTKTWFHTGAFIDRDHISNYFAGLLNGRDIGEYYREPGLTDEQFKRLLLDDTSLPAGLTAAEEREACRALKGMMLRQEVYALDGTDRARHPYSVTEQNFRIELLQKQGQNRYGAFFCHPREAITYHYERNPADPRIIHTMTLEVDGFGNILKHITIGYARRQSDLGLPQQSDRDKQAQVSIVYAENRFTNSINDDDRYRTPLPAEAKTYELTGYPLNGPWPRYQASDFVNPDPVQPGALTPIFDAEIQYEDQAGSGKQRRLIEQVRSLYRPDDFGQAQGNSLTLLPPGQVQSLAIPGENYKLAFTPGLLTKVYQRPLAGQAPENLLPDPADLLAGPGGAKGGYTDLDGNGYWWMPSGRLFFSPFGNDPPGQELAYARQHFFLPQRSRDPFHAPGNNTESFVRYDRYDLLIQETLDALGNRVTVGERDADGNLTQQGHDYRLLQPGLVMDPNRNRTAVAFDVLGMVVGTAVMGKPEEHLGDSLDGFEADLEESVLLEHLAGPLADPHAILQQATSRLVYDVSAYYRSKNDTDPQAAVAYTVSRETHVADLVDGQLTKVQQSFSYSDGFGREIQKKIQAEPGPVPQRDGNNQIVMGADGRPLMTAGSISPRWVGGGWTVFNNKGKPVQQYEPFFTDTHRFEFDVKIGVSSTLFYDPAERVVAALHPDHTWEKVIFDPWRQESWDVNDTALITDPKTDPDVGDFFKRLPDADYLPTWYGLRTDSINAAEFAIHYPDVNDRTNETRAAHKTELHAATPGIAHADSLGRIFLTLAHNKFKFSNSPQADPPQEEFYATRVAYDIEGNQREVIDAKDRIAMRYDYDLLGNRIHQASMEAGQRWLLNDVADKPIYAWDSRGHNFTISYDALRRPVTKITRGTSADSDPRTLNRDILVDKIEYGEPPLDLPPAQETLAQSLNLRTRVYQHFDGAGVATSAQLDANGDPLAAYDFKGNLLHSTRRLVSDYSALPDWSQHPQLGEEAFQGSTRYDALNRPIQSVAPHSSQPASNRSVIQPVFNEASLLERVDVWLERDSDPDDLLDPNVEVPSAMGVANIYYDAKGQRLRIDYKNGVRTRYRYDSETFRLTRLYTWRGAAFTEDCDNPQPPPPTIAAPDTLPRGKACGLQNLHYTYDPAGNITSIRDDAQQTIYFRNKRVEPSADYIYDAIYRLIEATGREHLGQAGGSPIPHSYNDVPRVGLLQPGDGNAMGNYLERYVYDAVGNFIEFQHHGTEPANPGWTRRYSYSEDSLLEPNKQSNRLSSTKVGNGNASPEAYVYDAHGDMLKMPQLQIMQWDFKDQMQMSRRQAVNADDADGHQHQGESTWYGYDASGQRIRKVTERQNGVRMKERIYIGGFEIYREYGSDGTGVTLARETLHVTDDRQRIALVETRTQGDDDSPKQLIRYQFGNHLGSASLELDDAAQIISYEEYYPYGSTSYQAVAGQTETPKRYRYAGMERDEESGMNYHGARYYTPWIGRWISCDPSGLSGGLNLYSYAAGSPVLFLDTTGNKPLTFPVNEEAQRKLWRGRPIGPTQTLSLPGRSKRGKNSGRSRKGKPTSKAGREGKEGGLEGGTGTAASKATEYSTSKYIEEGAGNGPGGLGEPGDVGTGRDVGTGTSGTGTPTGTGTETTTGGGRSPAGKQGGKKDDSKEGSPDPGEGKGKDPSSILDDLAALASLIADPESLYNAQQSGNTGKGAQIGSSFGFITGWLAQILVIAMVFGGKILKGLKALYGGLKKGFGKLSGVIERKLLSKGAETIIEKPTLQEIQALVPKGMDLQKWGAMIWGTGEKGALDPALWSRSAEELRQIPGLTVERAATLRNFFLNLPAGAGGRAPGYRVDLLNHIIRTLGGEP